MQTSEMAGSLPSGEVDVPVPKEGALWSECLRDLKRTLEGGSLHVFSRGRRFDIKDFVQVSQQGDVSRKACQFAFDELVRIIGFELQADAIGIQGGITPDATASGACQDPSRTPLARSEGPRVDASLCGLQPSEECHQLLDAEALEKVARRVAASISVGPGMEAIMQHSLPPALWQPMFALCLGKNQVRVVTLAFVGGPVHGEKPSSKSTPYMLRIATGNLLAAGSGSRCCYNVEHALPGTTTTAEHLADVSNDIFAASATGNWTSICPGAVDEPSSVVSIPFLTPRQVKAVDGCDPRMPVELMPVQLRPQQPSGDLGSLMPSRGQQSHKTHTGTVDRAVKQTKLADSRSVKPWTKGLHTVVIGAKLKLISLRARARITAGNPMRANLSVPHIKCLSVSDVTI